MTLALLAKDTFHGGAGTYSLLTACMGVGAVAGGLIAAHRARPTPRLLQVLALVFGGLLAAVALAPTLATAAVLIVFMGAASIGFIATANATLQLGSDPAMRGRVMALYAMAFLGTTPIGAPLVGAIAQWTSPADRPAGRSAWPRSCRRASSCGGTRPVVRRAGTVVDDAGAPGARGARAVQERRVAGWREPSWPVPPAAVSLARRLGLLGQAQHPLAHDVALDLGGPAPDGLRAGEEERGLQVADRVVVAAPLHP